MEKLLGALPLIRDLFIKLDLIATIDRLCPLRSDARVTHGKVIANRLTSPTPLVRIEGWARQWVVEEIFGIPPDTLNDDRIGRALEAIAEQDEAVVGSIGATDVFIKYKGQESAKRWHSALKGPLAVAPVFLQNNQRIHGLLHAICLALLLFPLIEREARRNTGPDGKVPGLYARRPARPTGRLILESRLRRASRGAGSSSHRVSWLVC